VTRAIPRRKRDPPGTPAALRTWSPRPAGEARGRPERPPRTRRPPQAPDPRWRAPRTTRARRGSSSSPQTASTRARLGRVSGEAVRVPRQTLIKPENRGTRSKRGSYYKWDDADRRWRPAARGSRSVSAQPGETVLRRRPLLRRASRDDARFPDARRGRPGGDETRFPDARRGRGRDFGHARPTLGSTSARATRPAPGTRSTRTGRPSAPRPSRPSGRAGRSRRRRRRTRWASSGRSTRRSSRPRSR